MATRLTRTDLIVIAVPSVGFSMTTVWVYLDLFTPWRMYGAAGDGLEGDVILAKLALLASVMILISLVILGLQRRWRSMSLLIATCLVWLSVIFVLFWIASGLPREPA